MTTTTFRQLIRSLLPSWLRTGEGELVQHSLMLEIDGHRERARLAARCGWPTLGPSDALAYQSRDRKIVRGIDESNAGFALRLIPWLDDHKVRGNPFAMLGQLQDYLNVAAGTLARTVDRRGNWFTITAAGAESVLWDQANWIWDAIAAAPQWARGWVILYMTGGTLPFGPTPLLGAATLWGGAIGTAGYTIGSTATPGQIASIKAIVREWAPAGIHPEWIILALDAASFAPASPEPTATWATWGAGAPLTASRLATARYVYATG